MSHGTDEDKRIVAHVVWSVPSEQTPLSVEEVTVCFNPETQSRLCASADLEEAIDRIWNDKLERVHGMYNGTKFRLASFEFAAGGDEPPLHLTLGLTDYKEFIGTHTGEIAKELHSYGLSSYGDRFACLSCALGVGAVLLTADDHITLLRRSSSVGEAPNCWDVPGGHPEPERVSCSSGDGGLDRAVAAELFRSIVEEVKDEVGLEGEEITYGPRLIGIFRNATTFLRPGLSFVLHTSLSARDVAERYNAGVAEAFESTKISFVPATEVRRAFLRRGEDSTVPETTLRVTGEAAEGEGEMHLAPAGAATLAAWAWLQR